MIYSGAPVVSRLAHFFPDRVESYTFVDIGYSAPGSHLDRATIEAINQNVSATLGYPPFGYFPFAASSESGPLVDAHVSESSFDQILNRYGSVRYLQLMTILIPQSRKVLFIPWCMPATTRPDGQWILHPRGRPSLADE